MATTLVFGVPGAGKTVLLQDMVHDFCLVGWTCLIKDQAGEWAAHDADGKENPRWRGAPPQLVEIGVGPDNLDAATAAVRELRDSVQPGEQGFAVLFPYPWEGAEIAEVTRRVGDVVIVDDEIDLCCTYTDWENNPYRDFFHRGRHLPDEFGVPRVIQVLGAARRPQNLHIDATSLADTVYVFRVQGSRTIARLESDAVLTRELSPRVRLFPNFHFIKWESSGEITEGVLTSPVFPGPPR